MKLDIHTDDEASTLHITAGDALGYGYVRCVQSQGLQVSQELDSRFEEIEELCGQVAEAIFRLQDAVAGGPKDD